MTELLAGTGLGLILSAPVGPVGVLAIMKKLDGNTRQAVNIAAGACVANGAMAWVATLPIDLIPPLPMSEHMASLLLAILFFGLAAWVWRTADGPVSSTDAVAEEVLHSRVAAIHWIVVRILRVRDMLVRGGALYMLAFGTGFCATALHPLNVLAFLFSFGGLRTQGIYLDDGLSQTLLIAGIVLGAFAMWLAMLEVAAWLGNRLSAQRIMPLLRRGVAVCMALGGVVALGYTVT